ncbi:hypothetical protein [Protofrankia symbiont of Coriaria ruscifolia]|uniref:hypothetical protein n=1 Tax=Protofrankia symbiont of Coriaria ruscifolia TaxID=1306542 RepID=UPI0010412052|nr:hypothetical protein [Protofrankia symbiont of Coriaria ruscifolia]
MIPLTANEIRHVYALTRRIDHPRGHVRRWSDWRRHQARARYCHYKRRIRAAQTSSMRIKTTPQPLLL